MVVSNAVTKRGMEILMEIHAGGLGLIGCMQRHAAHSKLEADGMIQFVQGSPSRYILTPLGRAEVEVHKGLWQD